MNADCVASLTERENRRFAETHPASLALRERVRASMPHGYSMIWFFGLNAQTDLLTGPAILRPTPGGT